MIGNCVVGRFFGWLFSRCASFVDVGFLGGAMSIYCSYLGLFCCGGSMGLFFTFKVCYIRNSENLQVYSASVEDFDEV